MATLKINKNDSRLIFYLHDYGRTKNYDWSIQIETKAEIKILTKHSLNESLVEVSCRGSVGGFELKELNKLENWINSSLKKPLTLELRDNTPNGKSVLKSSKNGKQWEVEVNNFSHISLGSERFDFDGNSLNNLAIFSQHVIVENLNKKDLERVRKWIQKCKKEITKIKARKDL